MNGFTLEQHWHLFVDFAKTSLNDAHFYLRVLRGLESEYLILESLIFCGPTLKKVLCLQTRDNLAF